jgi:hypothetical protein
VRCGPEPVGPPRRRLCDARCPPSAGDASRPACPRRLSPTGAPSTPGTRGPDRGVRTGVQVCVAAWECGERGVWGRDVGWPDRLVRARGEVRGRRSSRRDVRALQVTGDQACGVTVGVTVDVASSTAGLGQLTQHLELVDAGRLGERLDDRARGETAVVTLLDRVGQQRGRASAGTCRWTSDGEIMVGSWSVDPPASRHPRVHRNDPEPVRPASPPPRRHRTRHARGRCRGHRDHARGRRRRAAVRGSLGRPHRRDRARPGADPIDRSFLSIFLSTT